MPRGLGAGLVPHRPRTGFRPRYPLSHWSSLVNRCKSACPSGDLKTTLLRRFWRAWSPPRARWRRRLPGRLGSATLPWSNGPTEGAVNRLKAVSARCTVAVTLDLLRKRAMGNDARAKSGLLHWWLTQESGCDSEYLCNAVTNAGAPFHCVAHNGSRRRDVRDTHRVANGPSSRDSSP